MLICFSKAIKLSKIWSNSQATGKRHILKMENHYSTKFYNLSPKNMEAGNYLKKIYISEEKFSTDRKLYFSLAFFSEKRTLLAAVFQKYFPVTVISLTKFLLK